MGGRRDDLAAGDLIGVDGQGNGGDDRDDEHRRGLDVAPVPAGTRLRGRVSIMAAEDVPPYALRVTYKVTIEIEGGKRPACVAEVIGQHYR